MRLKRGSKKRSSLQGQEAFSLKRLDLTTQKYCNKFCSGNAYIVSSYSAWANNEVKKYDTEQNYVSKFATPQGTEILCINDYLYVSQWCVVKKYDLDGTLILSIGSGGTGDGHGALAGKRRGDVRGGRA